MNKDEINFALKLIDTIEKEVIGYPKIRVCCEGLKKLFKEQRRKNRMRCDKMRKSMSEEVKKENLRKLHEGRDERYRRMREANE